MNSPESSAESSLLLFVYENALPLAVGLSVLSVALIALSVFLVVRKNGILEERRRRKTFVEATSAE